MLAYVEKLNTFLTQLNSQLPEELFLCTNCYSIRHKELKEELLLSKQIDKFQEIIETELPNLDDLADIKASCEKMERLLE